MNKKKLFSLCLCTILTMGTFVGCGKSEGGQTSNKSEKVEVVKETAFETVPENALIPDYVRTRYENENQLLSDYDTVYITYWCEDSTPNPNKNEVLEKYGLSTGLSKVKELRDQNPEFYDGAISYIISKNTPVQQSTKYIDEMIVKAQDYLANSLLGENNELDLSKEFEELKPISHVQSYLKKNNIEITNVVYPQDMEHFHIGAGTNVVALTFTVEGTQNGKKFSETKKYDFHFAASQDLRDGADLRDTDNMSLMAVTESCFEGVNTWNTTKFNELLKKTSN